tara:strand:- start:18523 stop:18669 length:147 start_codon:yes stop_codon:yes gene_type:complete
MKNEKTIFEGNKTFTEVLVEGVLFAMGTVTALTLTAGLLIAFINLLNS